MSSHPRDALGICQAFNLTSLTSWVPHPSFPRVDLFDLSLTLLTVAPSFPFLFPPSSPSPTSSSPPAPTPAPPPPMQSRGADERPDRLSLLPVVRDLDEAVAGRPIAPPPPPGPQSQMEWDEEEAVAPPRSKNKVRQRVREVMYRRTAAAAAKAKAKRTAVQQMNSRDIKAPEYGPLISVNEKRKAGSVRNACIGIERRRKYEVCLPPFTFATPLTISQLSSLRAYDELMLPVAFARQRASLPKKITTKHLQQETSWPKKLKEKASTRSLKSATSFTGLRKFGGSSSSLRPSANSPRTPVQSPALGNLTSIPTRYARGSQESIPRPSPFGSANMPALGVDARVRPSAAKKERKTPPGQLNKIEISPFLAYENMAPATSPLTPPPRLTPSLRVPGSTTTLNTLGTSPSREFPSGPEDPFWDEAVTRVKAIVRRDQEEERRERKITAKAEQRVIRNISKDRDGRLKWAKLTIEMLAGKYDEHGWLPKKDPKEFDDEDWTFVLEVLNHKDTKALRDQLFKRPEWIEADKTRREKYEEEMRTNPTPEYLAALHAKEHKERRDYGFRKILGLLTAEELEAERHKELTPVGLGISSATEPATPLTASTTDTSDTTDHSLPTAGTNEPEYRGRLVNRSEYEETPSKRKGHKHGISSVARHGVEQMTDVFNTESFNPRLSILGSDEVKQYIKKNPPTRPSPPTLTPDRSHFNTSLDPRQVFGPGSSPGQWLSSKVDPAQRLRIGKKAASSNNLLEEYNRRQLSRTGVQPNTADGSPILPTLGVHPTLRVPENTTTSTARPAAGSQIPRLRKAASSIAPLNSSNAFGSIRRQVIAASPPQLSTTPSLQRPPKPRKPSTAVKLPNQLSSAANPPSKPKTAVNLPRKPASTPTSALRLSPVHELQETGVDSPPKSAPLIRRPSTSVKSPKSIAGFCSQFSSDARLQPLSCTGPSPSATATSQRSAVESYSQPPKQPEPVFSPLPLSYSRPSTSAAVRPQRPAVDSYDRPSPDGQQVSSQLPLNYSRPSPLTAAGSHDQSSPGGQLAFSPLPLIYSRPSPSAVVDSSGQPPREKQSVSSPLPLSYSRPSFSTEGGTYDQPSSDRQPIPTPLLLNYSRSSPSASDGFYIQSPPDEQPVVLPQGIAYAVLPPRPAVHSSGEPPPDRRTVSSPQQLGYSDSLPSTAVIPITTFVANDGDDKREYELYAPIPLPEYLPPRSLARMSRVPTFPDASDFLAAMEEDEPEGPYELPATPVRSPTPVRSTTPIDRLNARRSGIPVATGSNMAGNNSAIAGIDQLAASFSPSAFNVGPCFPPAPTNFHPVQDTSQRKTVSPPLHSVGPFFPSEPVNLQSVSTTGHRKEPPPILNVGPYFPPGPVSFGLDQNTGEKRDAPVKSDNVSPYFPPEQLTSQPHQTTRSKRKEPVRHNPSIPSNDLTPIDAAMAEWRNYQEKEPLVQYRGDRFGTMLNPTGTHNPTTEQAQGQSQHHGSHFEIMVDSSSMMYEPSPGEAQGRSQHYANNIGIMVDSPSMMYEPSPEKAQHHGNHFEIIVDSSDSHGLTAEQSQTSAALCNASLPTTTRVHNPAAVGSHMQGNSTSADLSRADKGQLMNKQLRIASSSPDREQQSSPSHALPSSKIPSFRPFSENKPSPGHRQPAAKDERSISLGNPQSGSPFTRNDRAMTNAGRLAKKFESLKYNVPATAPLRQGQFESSTPTKIRSPPAYGSSTPIGTRSRLRNKFSNVFYADPPPPIEQQAFSQVQQPTSSVQQPTSSNTGALDVEFEDVISAWESSSPAPIQSPAPFRNQEIQTLRSEIGLEPLRGHVLGEQKHPNHSYSWAAKKIMCRRIHNQGYVLPSLPSPAPGQKAYMDDRASEYFVGSPYTDESTGAQRCIACKSFCCRFTELLDHGKPTANDVVDLSNCHRAEETVASLRAKKPNGVEEWDSFLKCSQCDRSHCPNCIKLCREVLCQQPVCMDCIESTELCPIHNLI
jgi:hypothetical protein